MLSCIVRGSLGEKVTQSLASTACLSMVGAANKQLRNTQHSEVLATLSMIKALTPQELHELTTEAYRELCVRSQQIASST